MSTATTPTDNLFVITTKERARFEDQFRDLGPVHGFVTGQQCRDFFLLSQLPTKTLGKIWTLADRDTDGKMNIEEFLLACKLISVAVRGYEIPAILPPQLYTSIKSSLTSSSSTVPPLIPPQPPCVMTAMVAQQPPPSMVNTIGQSTPLVQPIPKPPNLPIQQQPIRNTTGISSVPYMSPVTTMSPALKTVASVPVISSNVPLKTFEKGSSVDYSAKSEENWAIPQPSKLRYTQIFNSTDKLRTGYLTASQAKTILIQSQLPQSILAQIWTLADLDVDGKLSCDEFIIAMYLCERAKSGQTPPHVLPPDLIPLSFRKAKTRHASISSQGTSIYQTKDHESTTSLNIATTFEDKRKENYEKGQAELERRRKSLMEIQRKENEERERKEREEIEKREKARMEAERKRQLELEAQLREKEELERAKEEERRRQLEQKELARREMERQRQQEIEKQQIQELRQQNEKEQENIRKLKAKNQSITIEQSQVVDQIKNISQKICDTRISVNNVKTVIDGMRQTRDELNRELSQLKTKSRDQNAKLLSIAQERAKLETRIKTSDNKKVAIKQLQDKIDEMQQEIDSKAADYENNQKELEDLKNQVSLLLSSCENMYNKYEEKRNLVLEKRNAKKTVDLSSEWDTPHDWPNTSDSVAWPSSSGVKLTKYRSLYEFVPRTADEISFQPGDIINVSSGQKGEPGWLYGEVRGVSGWFPETYVEIISGDTSTTTPETIVKSTQLENIDEVSESTSELNEPISKPTELKLESIASPAMEPSSLKLEELEAQEYYVANYRYQSVEPGDLNFNSGDVILVTKKEGEWWTGKIGGEVGIFPSNYVQKIEQQFVESMKLNESNKDTSTVDSEISKITESKTQIPNFDAMSYTSQTGKGKKPEIASVIAPYEATSSEQLTLQRGQLVMIRKKTESGWWEGELQAKGRKKQIGWFPSTYVKILSSSGRSSGRTTPILSSKVFHEVVIDKVVALYAYKASNPDELNFAKGDIISVTSKEEDTWWRGEVNGVSGLFPSNYVGPLKSADEAFQKKRNNFINELINTEKSYVDDLNIICKLFETPLRESKVISESNIDSIFLNIRDILQCNRRFYKTLVHRHDSGYDIYGDIMCDYIPRMTCYIQFCNNQLSSSSRLEFLNCTSITFREQLRKLQNNPTTKGMPLAAFLIKPTQRITKYPLIIRNIIENTSPDHSDRELLRDALVKVEAFCKEINESVRLTDNQNKLNWIQRHVSLGGSLSIYFNSTTNFGVPRKLLHYGILHKTKSGKELICFLFTDFLLFSQSINNKPIENKGLLFQDKSEVFLKIYKSLILIDDLVILNTDEKETSCQVLEISDRRNEITYYLQTASHNELLTWLKVLRDCQSENKQILKEAVQYRLSKMVKFKPYGRILLMIETGNLYYNIEAKLGRKPTDIFCHASLNYRVHKTNIAQPVESTLGSDSRKVFTLKWNFPMQFEIRTLDDQFLIEVYQNNLFSLNDSGLKLNSYFSQVLQIN